MGIQPSLADKRNDRQHNMWVVKTEAVPRTYSLVTGKKRITRKTSEAEQKTNHGFSTTSTNVRFMKKCVREKGLQAEKGNMNLPG